MALLSTFSNNYLVGRLPVAGRRPLLGRRVLLVLAALLYSVALLAQSPNLVSGTVKDGTGQGIPGVTIQVKGTDTGTATDDKGKFSVNAQQGSVLVVRGVGIVTQEVIVPSTGMVAILVKVDSKTLDDVVVTGTFDKRTAMNSSIAISSLDAQTVQLQQPVSAPDLLRNVPGVYVNSANGEIRNTVNARGVATPTNAGSGIDEGYYYISMQEDGLPITNAALADFGPDYFLRADATTTRVEALRGGTASILGPNAPGGIFNYISRNGKDQPGGEVRLRTGIQGNGNGYYRADADYGGELLKDKGLYYNVGGFYRYDQGGRNPGYAMNLGGQVKANLLKTYKSGSLKLYGKYLNDHNGSYEALPAVNFDNPQLAPGIKNTDTFLGSKTLAFDYPLLGGGTRHYDATNQFHSIEKSLGLEWNQDLGGGWTFTNNAKYAHLRTDAQYTAINSAVNLETIFPYLFSNTLGMPGTYNFTDLQTGQRLATVTSASGGDHTLTLDNLNSPIAKSVILHGLVASMTDLKEFIDQFSFHKSFGDKMGLTAGGYFANLDVDKYYGFVGMELATIQNQPHSIGITRTDAAGTVYQVTNPNGVAGVGGTGVSGLQTYTSHQQQSAGFANYTWKITPALNLDLGARYDHVRSNGDNVIAVHSTEVAGGGTDGNLLTLYDNYINAVAAPILYDKSVNTFSYSAALNYKVSDKLAIYGRFSNGKKAPNLESYMNVTTTFAAANLNPQAQVLKQAEVGVKYSTDKLNLVVTPFYSLLSNIRTVTTAQRVDLVNYNTPALLNTLQTVGLEIEANYSVTSHLNVRVAGTVQNPRAKDWKVWNVGVNGDQDDVAVDYSGNRVDNVPAILATVTPTYTQGKFFGYVSWKYTGSRPSNVPNTFFLPEYSVFDAAVGYNITPALSTQLNMTNIFNTVGVTSWVGPGSFPNSVDFQGFTPAKRAADNNATFGILTIQPRASFFSLAYKF